MKKSKKIILTVLLALFEVSCITLLFQEKNIVYLILMIALAVGYYFIMKKAKSKPAPQMPAPSEQREFYTKVKGVTFDCEKNKAVNRQAVVSQLKPGEALVVEKYTFDGKPAIMLLNQAGLDIGNVSADITKDIYNQSNITATVSEVTGGGELSFGCNVIIRY